MSRLFAMVPALVVIAGCLPPPCNDRIELMQTDAYAVEPKGERTGEQDWTVTLERYAPGDLFSQDGTLVETFIRDGKQYRVEYRVTGRGHGAIPRAPSTQ